MNIFSTSITLPQLFLATFLITMIIGIVILTGYFLKKIKPRTRPATNASPATTPATPATPSEGRKSWIPIIVILAVLVIAGYLLATNWAYIEGVLPATQKTVAPKFGCSSPSPNVYILSFNEDSTVLTTMCSEPLTLGQNFSLELLQGNTVFWDGKSNSNVGAEGVVVDSSQNGYKLEPSLPLGILMITVGGEPWLGIGSAKTYFRVTSSNLEVTDGKGKLLRSFPIMLPKDGGWGSKLSLGVNCQGKNKADQSKVCTAAFEVRQEYYKK